MGGGRPGQRPAQGRRGRRGAGMRVQETDLGKAATPPAGPGSCPSSAICPADGQGGCQNRWGRRCGGLLAPRAHHVRRLSAGAERKDGVVTRGCESDPCYCPQQVLLEKGPGGAWTRGGPLQAHTTHGQAAQAQGREGGKRDGPATRWEEMPSCRARGLPLRICASSNILVPGRDAGAGRKQTPAGVWGLGRRNREDCVSEDACRRDTRALAHQNGNKNGVENGRRGRGTHPQFPERSTPAHRHSQPHPPLPGCPPAPAALEPMQCS